MRWIVLVWAALAESPAMAAGVPFSATLDLRIGDARWSFQSSDVALSSPTGFQIRAFSDITVRRNVAIHPRISRIGVELRTATGTLQASPPDLRLTPLDTIGLYATDPRSDLFLLVDERLGSTDPYSSVCDQIGNFYFTATLCGGPWTTGALSTPSALRGSDRRTAHGVGSLSMVAPLSLTLTDIGTGAVQSVPSSARLTLTFAPEPGPLALGAAALACLALLRALHSSSPPR